jgi:hypothetical protein
MPGSAAAESTTPSTGGVLDVHQGLLTLAGGTVTLNVPNEIVKY